MKRWTAILLAIAPTLAITGCKVGPDYKTPKLDAPDAWLTSLASNFTPAKNAGIEWWKHFGDPTLDRLIELAHDGNLGIRGALHRIEAARATFGQTKGDRWPKIDATAAYRRSGSSENGLNDRVAGFQFQDRSLWSVAGELTWELDVWGRVRRLNEAVRADVEVSIEDFRDLLVILQATIATTYVDTRLLQSRIAITRSNLEIQERAVKLAESRQKAGLANEIDVTQARVTMRSTESQLPRFRAALRASLNRLAVLTGKRPGEVDALIGPNAVVPVPPDRIGIAIPADVLRQRPDIRRAERRLAAATARIGVKTADLYPKFTIFGTLGFESVRFDDLIDKDSKMFSVGPSLRWPIWHAGRIKNAIRVEDEKANEALATYEDTVLKALEDVENALFGHLEEKRRRTSLAAAVRAAARAVTLSMDLYESGEIDYLRVIEAQREQLRLQDLEAEARARIAATAVSLYRALGGGWRVKPEAPVPTRTMNEKAAPARKQDTVSRSSTPPARSTKRR